MDQLKEVMCPMKRTLKTFDQKEIRTEELVLDRNTSFTVKVMEGVNLPPEWTNSPSNEELQPALDTKKSREEIRCNYALMQKLKAKNPSLYEKCSMPGILRELVDNYPSPQTFPDGS